MPKPKVRVDKELEEFRNLMEPPGTFDEGFRWSTLIGAVFLCLFMVPGALYMGLVAGQGIGPAAQWVTVILFIEVARRAQQSLKRAEIFVLFFMAGAMVAATTGGMQGLLWRQFFARSDAAAAYGINVPTWWAPDAESESYSSRLFLHLDWLPILGLVVFQTLFGQLTVMVLGYGLFRLASDVEKLPFPMAPIGAQGVMALAEDLEETKGAAEAKEKSWRWRIFSIGGALGMAFGLVYLFLPTITGALTGEPVMIFPIPFSDFTPKTGAYLPAVATGIAWNAVHVITGMVLPFWAMAGSFIGLVVTFIANPILYHARILTSWNLGDTTVSTVFKNNVDFYFSFGIGISLAIAIAGICQAVRSYLKTQKAAKARRDIVSGPAFAVTPKGRGDIPFWLVIAIYLAVTSTYVLVSGYLIGWHTGVMVVLVFFGFVYTPLLGYVTTRLEGIAGQVVDIPMARQAAFILSGYQGVNVWFIPVPGAAMAQIGRMSVFYRQCELTGTRFRSIWKSTVILYPLIVIFIILFSNFIWGLADCPSAVYPYAQIMWDLQAANSCIMFSATLGEYSIFEDAFNWSYLFSGVGFGGILFGVLTSLGAPIFFVYGVVRGLGQSMPHVIIPQFAGALVGRFYFRRRLGLKWRQYAPVVAAGFACGMGLISIVGVGITFISKAVLSLPF